MQLVVYPDDLVVDLEAEVATRKIERWIDVSQLKLTTEKTEANIFLHRRLNGFCFKYGQVEITPSIEVKDLGT